uniref:EC33 protein n=1 Tax=Colletotrichum higginsianum TaxID=80884 RepID=I2G7A9_9PEZI|nr:EC33 protein [Colletotrichum higginsianum]
MRLDFISIALTALAVFTQETYACQSTADCPQNCGGFADNLCRLPGNVCECVPY